MRNSQIRHLAARGTQSRALAVLASLRILNLAVLRVLNRLALPARSGRPEDAEILVLRHQVSVP